MDQNFKPNLLCVAPPYGDRAPAGTAYLLGFLKSRGCDDFDFLDLRLGAPFDFTPTYRTTGAFGESYVMDLPDLPLVLQVIEAFHAGRSVVPQRTPAFDHYCLERGISPYYLQSYLAHLDRYMEAVFAQIPRIDFIGFSTWMPNFLSTVIAAACLKRRRNPPVIVAGGPQVTASHVSAALTLRSGLFDVVALSEGEETLYEVYSEFRRTGEAPKRIGGTLTLDPATGELVKVDRRLLRLDQLPPPSFDEIPIHAYQQYEAERALPFQLSRGCTDRCSFCSEWVFWKNFRNDAPDHAVEHLKELKARYDLNLVQFTDSLLNGHQKRLIGFAEQVLHDGLKIAWTGFMRANMDAETATLISRAGCTAVFIGVESFSDEALELMNKRRTEADNIQAITTFLEHGIHVTAGFIPGFPGDSRRGFLHSVQVMRDLQHRYPGRLALHEEPFTVMANAPLHGKLQEMGLTPRPWADEYLDIAPRYRDVTSAVHCSVEGPEQGLERLGRMAIVGTIKSDAPVPSRFDEGDDEPVSVQAFEFTPVVAGYYMARIKAPAGHRYCLLVDDAEWQELIDLQEECCPIDFADARVRTILDRLSAAHLLAPDRDRQRVVRFLYRRELADHHVLTVSPLVVARDMGWRQRHQVLFIDTVTHRILRKNPAVNTLIARLKERPRSIEQLWRDASIREVFRDLRALRRLADEMKEFGAIMICDAGQTAEALREERVQTSAPFEPVAVSP